jgi:hypothetical protein
MVSFFRALVIVVFAVLFFSCDDKKPDDEKTNFIEARVNGITWSPSSVKCTLLVDENYNFRVINFTASSGGKIITIEADDHATAGSMNTGTRTFEGGTAYFLYNDGNTPYNTFSGSITISSVEGSSQLVTGTFDFTAEDNEGNQVHVTAGSFKKVSYSVKVQ